MLQIYVNTVLKIIVFVLYLNALLQSCNKVTLTIRRWQCRKSTRNFAQCWRCQWDNRILIKSSDCYSCNHADLYLKDWAGLSALSSGYFVPTDQ